VALTDKSRLSLGTKVAWGFADAGVNVFVYVKAVVILAFMTQYMGVGAGLAGLVTGLVVLTDMITDPLVGAWSDRRASRFGRRRPFMVVGAVFMFAFTYLMFTTPGLTGAAAALWVFIFYALASIGFTMVAVPYGAMATEMTSEPQERTVMMGFRFAFASVGLLLAGLLATPGNIASGSAITWIIIAFLMLFPVFVCVIFTNRAPRISESSALGIKEQLALVRAHPNFIRHVISYGIMTVGVAILSGGILFITTDVSIRQAQSGAYDHYFENEFVFSGDVERERLGLIEPENGWKDRRGQKIGGSHVQRIDPTVAGWFDNIDFHALQVSDYGRIQADAVQGVLNRAVQSRVIGPASALVGLAGFFSAVFALFLVGSILSQIFWVPLARRIGRGRALVGALSAYGLLACAYLIVLRGGDPSFIVYGAFVLGICNGAYQNLPWAILPTMIDQANAHAKVNVEGIFNGFWLSGQKIANSAAPMLFGWLIALFGYEKSTVGLMPQSEQASSALEISMTLLPGLFFLLAIPMFLTVRRDLRS